MKLLSILLAGSVCLVGQTRVNLANQTKAGIGATLPATCSPGQMFFQTGFALLYTCTAPNTWTLPSSNSFLDWGFLLNIPASFPPFTHAATHRNGGTDEVGSATPGPNIIAKAGPGGQLAMGFIAAGTPTGTKFVRDDGTLAVPSGGGSGSVVLTSGAGVPVANCTAPSSSNLAVYLDTTNHDQWWCSATNTWLKILSVTGSGPYEVIGGTGTAPSTPASGTVACYFDSTTNTQICIDSNGNAFSMVKGAAAISHQFVTNVDTSGLQHQAAIAGPDLPAVTLATGTSVSLTPPRQYYVCTGTCTVTPPVPATGYEFCVMNANNVGTVITLAALGSSARYEATARTSYGTAGTGTFVSGGSAADKVCLVGLDSTHYLTVSFNGTWSAN